MKTKCKQIVKACVAGVALASLCMACTQQSDLTSLPAAPGKGVTLTLPIAVTGMEGAETRAEVAKDAKETEIKKLWLLQFDGTDDNAKLLQCVNVTNWADNKIMIKFLPSTKTTQGVYLVANTTPDVVVNTTTKSVFLSKLATFSPIKGNTVALTVPSTGLPMCGYQEFDPMTVNTVPAITLKTLVSKLIVTYDLKAPGLVNYLIDPQVLTLKCITNGTTFKEQTAGNGVYTPNGVNRNTSLTVFNNMTVSAGTTSTHVCYFSENLGGQKTKIQTEKERGLTNSSADGMYLELTSALKDAGKLASGGKANVRFVYFLGAENNLNDFNVVRNHVYKVTVYIKGIFKDDERISYY